MGGPSPLSEADSVQYITQAQAQIEQYHSRNFAECIDEFLSLQLIAFRPQAVDPPQDKKSPAASQPLLYQML